MTQLDLLGYQPAPPTAPYVRSSGTSRDAARSIRASVNELAARVLACIQAAGDEGATDEQVQQRLGMNPSTQRPRRGELEAAGLIRKHGTTRPTSSGRAATVWVVA